MHRKGQRRHLLFSLHAIRNLILIAWKFCRRRELGLLWWFVLLLWFNGLERLRGIQWRRVFGLCYHVGFGAMFGEECFDFRRGKLGFHWHSGKFFCFLVFSDQFDRSRSRFGSDLGRSVPLSHPFTIFGRYRLTPGSIIQFRIKHERYRSELTDDT